MPRQTAQSIKALKGKRKLSVLTAYDYPTASLVDRGGVDMVLVGDSLNMVVLGRDDTLSLTMEEMLHHCRAVSAGVKQALVVADMPFLSYETSVEQAVANAGLLLKHGGVRAVKLEGAAVLPQIKALVQSGIPVQGHLGLTPQRLAELGGYLVQGKTAEAAKTLIDDAQALAQAGCFSLVLEMVPAPIADIITAAVPIPTIGIGAGSGCDGQVLVLHDVLGLFERFTPRFVKQYARLSEEILKAVTAYREDVEAGRFPGPEHAFDIPAAELDKLR